MPRASLSLTSGSTRGRREAALPPRVVTSRGEIDAAGIAFADFGEHEGAPRSGFLVA
jgi:hypothetical protein